MPIIGALTVHLTGLGTQQMLQGPRDTRNPGAPSPPPDQLRGTQRGLQTPQREAVLARLIHDDDGHLARGRTGSPKPRVVDPCLPRGLPPPPPLACDEVVSFDLLSIGPGKYGGLFAFYKQGALMRLATMLHKLRGAEPTGGNHYWRRQLQATLPQRRHPLVEHHPGPTQFIPARRPRPTRSRSSHGKVHWDDQATIADDQPAAVARPCLTTHACAGYSTTCQPHPVAHHTWATPSHPRPRSTASDSGWPGSWAPHGARAVPTPPVPSAVAA